MMRRLQFAVFITLIAVGAAPVHAAAPGSVTGVVRNSAGVPQIGAVVQLLRPDLSVLAVVYTNDEGHFTIPSVAPGRYSLKAMGATFLPSLRENIRVHSRQSYAQYSLRSNAVAACAAACSQCAAG